MLRTKPTTIVLNNFLRKSKNAFALKAIIRKTGADLHRIRRSRNWQLNATNHQISQIIEGIDNNDDWLWLSQLLTKKLSEMSIEELEQLARRLPQLTVNELVNKTGCTLSQARLVIDKIEWQDD